MMGLSHAVSGAAAWVAVTATTVPALGWHPLEPSSVALGALVCAGAALLPDADHHDATIAHSVPLLGRVAAGALGRLSGGHRKGMHSLLAVAGVVALAVWLGGVRWSPSGWPDLGNADGGILVGPGIAVALCTVFAVKALGLARTWTVAWIVGLAAAAATALLAPEEFAWTALCLGVGYATHLAGDLLTVQGVPLLWPLRIRPPRAVRQTPLARDVWLPGGSFAIPLLGTAGSIREWALTAVLGAYALWGVAASLASAVG